MEQSVKLIENFVSWQGEGPDSGRRMIILRFKTCNKKCPWCDTSVKMRITAEAPHLLSDIQKSIYENQAGIMVTGGEPTVAKHFNECLMLLNDLVYPIANVESNGFKLEELISSVDPLKPVRFIYSPKIFNDQDYEEALDFTQRVAMNNPKVSIKLVYDGNKIMDDFMERLDQIFNFSSASQFLNSEKVWVMPEGTTGTNLIMNSSKVFDVCEKYNFNFSSRNHIIYGFV